mmetsp:Transcript_17404/g.29740  ORF Transcript_17404/g.29740 Transcript_17404/m.29740 type:complete len:182 (-) Transcript_17404:38-583(-)
MSFEPAGPVDPASGSIKRVKAFVLGESQSGKTCLVRRIVSNSFEKEYQETLGLEVSFKEYVLQSQNEMCMFELWSPSGALKYLPVAQQNYQGADVVFLVYYITELDSLQKCMFWRNEILRAAPGAKMYLIGNKIDMTDSVRVSETVGEKQAEQWGIPHYRLSAKTGNGVNSFMEEVIRKLN